jgi:hypothetical protein
MAGAGAEGGDASASREAPVGTTAETGGVAGVSSRGASNAGGVGCGVGGTAGAAMGSGAISTVEARGFLGESLATFLGFAGALAAAFVLRPDLVVVLVAG